jgi:glucose/arabinose dehydrogenase
MGIVALATVFACTSAGELATTVPPSTVTSTSTTLLSNPTSSTSPVTTSAPATTTTLPALQTLRYDHVADLPFPVQVTSSPGGARSYVITKDGRVWVLEDGSINRPPVMDIGSRVRDSGEQGLLSIALHPDDSNLFYLHYSANDGDTVVSEFRFRSPTLADPASERVLLRLDQPASNHNGGMIQFAEDGTLILGLGDGGGGGDRFGNGQNLDTLLGGLVALRVDGDPDPTLYSHGLRNPWRFWIDDGLVYIADVGQSAFEEVSVTRLAPGVNYGWPITEGLHCFRPSAACDTTGLTLPVIEVAHGDAGTCSITGGIVYRGSLIPELDGFYLYSDYCGGYLRGFRFEDGAAVDEIDFTDQVGVPGSVTGFGVDGGGEVYVATTEALYRLAAVR